LERMSIALLQHEMPVPKPVRLLGVSLSSLETDNELRPNLTCPFKAVGALLDRRRDRALEGEA
jgi:hypothetical protein